MTTSSTGYCPVCGCELAHRLVFCSRCEAPHHKECFEYVGQCAIFGCAAQSYKQTLQPQVGAPPVEIRKNLKSLSWRQERPPFVIEYVSWREGLFGFLLLFSIGMALVTGFDQGPRGQLFRPNDNPFLGSIVWIVLACVLIYNTDDHWLVDPSASTIWRHYWFFGKKKLVREVTARTCTFVRLYADQPANKREMEYPLMYWRLQVGRRDDEEIDLRSWKLPMDKKDLERIPDPEPHMIDFASNVADVMGHELQIVRKPAYRQIVDGIQFRDGDWGKR